MSVESSNTPKSGFFLRLFWKACGADRRILEQCGYREHVKYACLGGIVVATGLMAGLAGGYAFYTIFEPKSPAMEAGTDIPTVLLAIFFGIIWGMIIFNIDRFIITSTGQGDGTEAITKEELRGALPRIIMGIIIAITISKPLEIRIFKSEIDVALEEAQLQKESEFLASLDDLYNPRVEAEQQKIDKWENEIRKKEDRYKELENEYNNEITRDDRRGVGPIAGALLERMDRAQTEIDEVKAQNKPLIQEAFQQKNKHEKERQEQINRSQRISNGLDGLLERIKLSHEIAGWGISLFITLLFVAIELTPIFFKLMLIKGPYDFLSDNQKELIKAKAGIEVKYNYYQDEHGKERDLINFHGASRLVDEQQRLTEAQKELNDYIIQKWLESEKQKVDENLGAYINLNEANGLS